MVDSRVFEKAMEKVAESIDGITLKNEEQVYISPDAAADTWDAKIFRAPSDINIKDVLVVPNTAIGQATNFMSLEVINKGTDGTGTTSLGSRNVNGSNTITVAGIDLVATNADVLEGSFISLKKTKNGDGQAWPGGLVIVRYEKA